MRMASRQRKSLGEGPERFAVVINEETLWVEGGRWDETVYLSSPRERLGVFGLFFFNLNPYSLSVFHVIILLQDEKEKRIEFIGGKTWLRIFIYQEDTDTYMNKEHNDSGLRAAPSNRNIIFTIF